MIDSDNLISSSQNPNIKAFKKLQQKKYRDELGLFVAENPLTIRDGIKHGANIKELYLTPTFEERQADLFNEIITNVPAHKVYRVAESVFASSVSLEHPQGIAAVYEKPSNNVDFKKSVVFLNGVSDPGNVGAIMRSCAAFGVQAVIADMDSADFYNPKTVSAAKESIFLLSLARKQAEFLAEIKKTMPVYGLDRGGSSSIEEVELKAPLCFVFGSEAHGISAECRQLVGAFVKIHMDAESVESLNVAASAAIALHRVYSQKEK